jgi:Rap1a immunity proteins
MKRIITRSVVAAVISVGILSAAAGKAAAFATGNNLLAWCVSASRTERGLCHGYILGIADAMAESNSLGRVAACIPGPVRTGSPGRLYQLAQQFLALHPEKRRLSASSLVANALADAFPCK